MAKISVASGLISGDPTLFKMAADQCIKAYSAYENFIQHPKGCSTAFRHFSENAKLAEPSSYTPGS